MRVGHPHDPHAEVGALVHPEHYERVLGDVAIGREEGRLVAGSGRADHLPEGNYLAPTVFADVPPTARIFPEEIVGPVVGAGGRAHSVGDEREAVAIANDVRYGPAGYVWTRDLTGAP